MRLAAHPGDLEIPMDDGLRQELSDPYALDPLGPLLRLPCHSDEYGRVAKELASSLDLSHALRLRDHLKEVCKELSTDHLRERNILLELTRVLMTLSNGSDP